MQILLIKIDYYGGGCSYVGNIGDGHVTGGCPDDESKYDGNLDNINNPNQQYFINC